jgi:hypothetical protein
LAAIFSVQGVYAEPMVTSQQAVAEYTLEFPTSHYPETGAHIKDAIADGHSAVCTIDWDGADIKHISPKDNRGAGSWVGRKLDDYPDGTRVEFIVK